MFFLVYKRYKVTLSENLKRIRRKELIWVNVEMAGLQRPMIGVKLASLA